MGTLTPDLDILSAAQQAIWPQLKATPKDFVLYGGTAIALRAGHRQSVDFDFFSARPFEPLTLRDQIPYLKDQAILQEAPDTLTCEVSTAAGTVKISFFGGLTLQQVDPPDRVESNGIAVASLRDLFGMKCATVPQRSAVRDYIDIHALIGITGLALADGIACALAIYGDREYSPICILRLRSRSRPHCWGL
jgi:hypothetical protein